MPWANSLWHLDGHHALIRWKFVIHGSIDGKSRKIVYLNFSTNNKAETVHNLFLISAEHHGWPSHIRVDYGVENTLVCDKMVAKRGPGRGSYTAGSSTRNQRIERLWRDVFRCVATMMFYYMFYGLEQSGILDLENPVHLFMLHYVFLQRINVALNEFMEAYNNHRLSTEHNWTRNQIWFNSMSNPANPITNDLVDEEINDIQYYGEDPEGPYPINPDVNNVMVSPVVVPLAEEINNFLRNSTDHVRESPDMGIDIYLVALSLIHETLGGQL